MSVSLPEGSALAEQIAAARWYSGKGAVIETVTEQDRLELPGGAVRGRGYGGAAAGFLWAFPFRFR